MRMHALIVGALLAVCGAFADARESSRQEKSALPNILVLIADDTGIEQFSVFGIGASPANTPAIDALAAGGMSFSNMWSTPMCSSTRATILAGRYGFRTGVGAGVGPAQNGPYPEPPELMPGAQVEMQESLAEVRRFFAAYSNLDFGPWTRWGLPSSPPALPELLKQAAEPYATAAIGKWHLADSRNGWLNHAGNLGFDHFSLLMKNQPESYFSWWENINGRLHHRQGYTPDQKIDDALEWVRRRDQAPWFLWLAFNLPHYPLHIPPRMSGEARAWLSQAQTVDLMIEYLDAQIARLFDGIGSDTLANTVVIFLGDNGTTPHGIDPPLHPDRAKFTVYEGGVRVPLIVSGSGVPKGVKSAAMVNTTDLYATILEVAGLSRAAGAGIDSISLAPYFSDPKQPSLRSCLYTEMFATEQGVAGGGFAIRDQRFKLVRIQAEEELYDLASDPWENIDLLASPSAERYKAHARRLASLAERLRASSTINDYPCRDS